MSDNNSKSNEENEKYSWNPEKRKGIIAKRGLDFVELADFIFADPKLSIIPDARQDYSEERYLAYAEVGGERFCLCFTLREERIHLITIFKKHYDAQWRRNYENA
ncbi:MAG: BrnT family toxin [Spirochaetaceae bacterium]|nr:BrnT family toxin [Spirochaetaceae bacterium]